MGLVSMDKVGDNREISLLMNAYRRRIAFECTSKHDPGNSTLNDPTLHRPSNHNTGYSLSRRTLCQRSEYVDDYKHTETKQPRAFKVAGPQAG